MVIRFEGLGARVGFLDRRRGRELLTPEVRFAVRLSSRGEEVRFRGEVLRRGVAELGAFDFRDRLILGDSVAEAYEQPRDSSGDASADVGDAVFVEADRTDEGKLRDERRERDALGRDPRALRERCRHRDAHRPVGRSRRESLRSPPPAPYAGGVRGPRRGR